MNCDRLGFPHEWLNCGQLRTCITCGIDLPVALPEEPLPAVPMTGDPDVDEWLAVREAAGNRGRAPRWRFER